MADHTAKPPASSGNDTLVHPRRSSLTDKSEKTTSSLSDHTTEKHTSNIDRDVEHGIPIVNTTDDGELNKEADITRIVSVTDSNIVDWMNKDDPRRPINWTTGTKWKNLSIISMLTFLTPLASSMVAPAIPLVMRDFHSSNSTVASFIVSIYVMGYAVGPLFIAPLSEIYGRIPVYHACNIMFVIWNLACAVAPTNSVGALLIFRLLGGIAGSCPITIFAGSIADVFIQEKRGGAMAACAIGPLIGKKTFVIF